MCVLEWAQSYLTLCDPVDYSLLGSSVHGILQTRTLEWVSICSLTQGLNWHLMQCRWILHQGATWEALRNSPWRTEAESRAYWVKFKVKANYKRSVDPFRAN